MRVPAVRGAALPAAALAFAALFLSNGSSQSRLFWIGSAAVIVAAVGWTVRPPALPRRAKVFFVLFAAFVLWQGASIAWSIEPSRSWDYANRSLVYFAFAAVGALLGRDRLHPPRRRGGGAARRVVPLGAGGEGDPGSLLGLRPPRAPALPARVLERARAACGRVGSDRALAAPPRPCSQVRCCCTSRSWSRCSRTRASGSC